MAYMNQEKKAKIKAALDIGMKDTNIKYSLSVRNHSTIVCTIKSGPIDFIQNYVDNHANTHGEAHFIKDYIDVNPYHYQRQFTGHTLKIISNILGALNIDNHDNSDIQSDYFDVGHYVDVNIGSWDKPYQLVK